MSEKKQLEEQAAKQSKGTKLVICLQNYVRKMLQEKLEKSAKDLESLGVSNKAAQEEAKRQKERAAKLEQDFEESKSGHDTQIKELEGNITEIKQ